jgi:hypothetical protein
MEVPLAEVVSPLAMPQSVQQRLQPCNSAPERGSRRDGIRSRPGSEMNDRTVMLLRVLADQHASGLRASSGGAVLENFPKYAPRYANAESRVL